MSLSFPLSSCLVAELIKREYNLPWIALFYDPWIDNPYRHHPHAFFRKMDLRLEQKVAAEADACIFTNPTMESIWKRKYPKSKTYSLPFCYTRELINHPFPAPSFGRKSLQLLYAGLSNEQRNLQDLIRAVQLLEKEGYSRINRLKIRIAHKIYEPDKALVESSGLQSLFCFTGFLSEDQLRTEYMNADVFVVIDAPGTINVHFPSKLMDYFYYRRPILGITPPNGGTADELRASGNTIINNGDVPSIAQFLKRILDNGAQSLSYDPNYYQQFTPERASSLFNKIVQSVL